MVYLDWVKSICQLNLIYLHQYLLKQDQQPMYHDNIQAKLSISGFWYLADLDNKPLLNCSDP
jgi:chaperone required for assembly of F1-ATPase